MERSGEAMTKPLVFLGVLCSLLIYTKPAEGADQAPRTSLGKLTVPLDSGWEFRQSVIGPASVPAEWRPAMVPGVVHTDLLRNRLIPDPFFRDNEEKLQWIENADWEYRTKFTATPEMRSREHVEMVFEGLDTLAEVYVNESLVLKADNMFREWRVDVTPLLKAGENEVRVVFRCAITGAAEVAAADKWRQITQPLPPEKSYIRKAAYEYGWDWGPRFVTCGIWRPARIEAWGKARISNVYIRQRDVTKPVARVSVEVEITSSVEEKAEITIESSHGGKTAKITESAELHKGLNQITVPLEIARPELWYPAGYGEHPLYDFHVGVKMGGAAEDARVARAGLRSVVLRRETDQWGRSFEFVINGIPIFAKGADVIPFDSFPTRVTTEQYRKVLQGAVDANMNMIRHWGGGYYETGEFYDICDELGLMVWQDFMFGNDWQPGTYDFKLNVEKEVEDQLRRLRNHPSIVLWCGNNETETSWQWARTSDVVKNLSPDVQRHMWQDYLTLFSGVIASTVQRLNPEVPYWPSSSSADYEDVTDKYQSGDEHNWNVWHGMAPLRDYEKSFPRFMTEFGFQSFPEMRTIEAFTQADDRTGITTPVMLAHQKNPAGNQKIHEYMLRDYPEPKDFASFLYVSQVLQAEAIKIGAEHLRRIRPRSMGSLYWQLNDCWPVASWSSIDYYGRWKALHYYARRFYNDVLVLPREDNGAVEVYGVSDRTTAVEATLRLRLMTMDGTVLKDTTRQITLEPLASKLFMQLPREEYLGAVGTEVSKVFAVAELMAQGKTLSRNLLFFVPTRDVVLPQAKIVAELHKRGDYYVLRVSSERLARDVYIHTGDVEAAVSDNYFDLLPGTPVEIEIRTAAGEEALKAALQVSSLVDAFAPVTGNAAAPSIRKPD
jgi:beta-mannosidase